MTITRSRRSGYGLLGIYLNDHLAGATVGTELAHRIAASHGTPADGTLQWLAVEVAQDRVRPMFSKNSASARPSRSPDRPVAGKSEG